MNGKFRTCLEMDWDEVSRLIEKALTDIFKEEIKCKARRDDNDYWAVRLVDRRLTFEELEKIYNEIAVTLDDFKESLPVEGETTVSCIGMQFSKGLLATALGFGFERTHISGRTLWLLNLNTIADLMPDEEV